MQIVKMREADTETVFAMMRGFYSSAAVIHTASDRVLRKDIADCVGDCPFVEGYLFRRGEEILGYGMVSKSYTTEYGGLCIWVEDLFFKEAFRGKGFAGEFFRFLEETYPEAVRFKLEVEQENKRAIAAYHKAGYEISEYHLMTKEIDKDLS